MRRIKSYENMSKEGLLIVLLKSKQSLANLYNKVKKKKNPGHNDPDYGAIWNVKDLFGESMKTIANQ